ncbi:MAG: hypothetical protein HPY85_12800 [Anaerolineae bacterium]|nr:hypothetical protein [Anaerolineae bacterium]
MLITLSLWILILAVSLGYGFAAHALLQRGAPAESPLSLSRLIPLALLGFVVVNVLATLLSLVMPIAALALLLVAAPALVLFTVFLRKFAAAAQPAFPLAKRTRWLFIAGGLVLLALTAWLTTGAINNSDTYIYHAQSIRWIESYPAIRGLGNFFNRLAYNSNWFVQNALFSFAWLGGPSFHVLNGFLVFVVHLFGLYEFCAALQARQLSAVHWLGLFLIPLGIISIGTQASAPSTDLPAAYAGWMAAFLAIRAAKDKDSDPITLAVVFGLVAFALIIKISIAPLVQLPLWLSLRQLRQGKFRRVLLLWVWMAVIALPWMARNVLLSGYLVYPASQTGLPVSWKIPRQWVEQDSAGIRAWGFNERAPYRDVLAQPFPQRIKTWFFNLTRNQQGMVLFSLGTPLLLITGGLSARRKEEPAATTAVLEAGWIFFACELTWLWISPNLRFGYVYVLFLCALGLALLAGWALRLVRLPVDWAGLLAVLLVTGVLALLLVRSLSLHNLLYRAAFPQDYALRATDVCTINAGTQEIFCARDYGECGYHDFPCHAWGNDYARMVGDTFTEGFYLELPEATP